MPLGKEIENMASRAGKSAKDSAQRLWAWVKDHPVPSAILIGGVILLALLRRERPVDQREALSSAEAGGMGDLGFESPQRAPGQLTGLEGVSPSQGFGPETLGLEEVSPTFGPGALSVEEVGTFDQPSGIGEAVKGKSEEEIFWEPEPETTSFSNLEREEPPAEDYEYYQRRSEELEELAGQTEDQNVRSLLAYAARETGKAGFYKEMEATGDLEAYQQAINQQRRQNRQSAQMQRAQRADTRYRRIREAARKFREQRSRPQEPQQSTQQLTQQSTQRSQQSDRQQTQRAIEETGVGAKRLTEAYASQKPLNNRLAEDLTERQTRTEKMKRLYGVQ